MDRHAAHGNVITEMLATLGQRYAERGGGDFGVLKEQLIKIAHAIEQQIARIYALDLKELGHHGRHARGGGRSIIGLWLGLRHETVKNPRIWLLNGGAR